MKKPLKSIVTSLGSMLIILISTTQTSESCGWGPEGEDYRVAFFTSKVLGDDVFQPFYYTSKMINGYVPNFESDKMRNLKLWQAELGSSVTIEDLDELLYQAETEAVLEALYDDKLGATFTENTFVKALEKNENESLLEYFIVAKVNEYVNFIGYIGDTDPWGWEEEAEEAPAEGEFPVPSREEIMAEIDKQLASVTSNFLKQRYAYLQLINYRYSNQKEKGMAIFKQYFNKNNDDIITAWAIFHAAACTSNQVESNYLLSLAFDKCDSKKVRCYYGFNKELLAETVAYAGLSSEKATIYAMTGMNYPGREMDLIQKVYAADAKNKNLRGLIYREISKIEDWLLTPKITGMSASVQWEDDNFYGFDEYDYVNGKYVKVKDNEPQLYRNEVNWAIDYFNLKNYYSDLTYTREFRSFLLELLNKTTETAEQDFLKLAISHLYFIDDEPNEALKYNQMVSGNNAQTKVQQQINNILLLSLTNDITTENTKNDMLQSLRWLENHLNDFDNPLRTISQLNLYLSKLYYRKGDLVTAAFLHQKSIFTAKQEWEGSAYYNMIAFFDRYATIGQVEEAVELLDKTNPTDFEKYLFEKYTASISNYLDNKRYIHGGWHYEESISSKAKMKLALIDLQGTIAFRQDDLTTALSFFKKLPIDYWQNRYVFSEYLSQSPFTKNDVLMNNGGAMTANKAVVVEKLLALKQKAENQNDAEAYFELANAYFNFTYHGNSWMMFSYGKYADELGENSKIGYWSYSFYPNAEKYADVYYNCDRANYFYQKAVGAATDIELEARAAMMVEYCNKIKTPTNEYLKAWSQKYKSTKTYKNSNCLAVKKW